MTQENKMGIRPVFSLLMSMALPPIISMWIQSMYNIVDSMFVARYSEDALTAVSLAFPIQNLILAVAVGTGVGMNSYISRKLGEGDKKEANFAATHGVVLALMSGLVFVIIGLTLIKPFFRLYTQDSSVFSMGVTYTSIVTIFSFGSLVHIAIEKILQATGKMIFPMLMQAFGALVNIVLDPLLIFGYGPFPRMGVAGAAVATIIGQISAMLFSVIVLLVGKNDVKITFRGFRLRWSVVGKIYAVGFPSILMNSLGSVLVTGLNAILVQFSNLAVTVYGVVFKLQTFIYMPCSGLIQGAMPIMGYNYGAGKRKRLLDALRYSLLVSCVIMAAGTLLFWAAPEMLLSLFDASSGMIEMGSVALRLISISYIPAALCFVFSTLFQAMGQGGYSLVIFLLRQLIIPLPAAYLMSIVWGVSGVWLAFPLAEVMTALLCLLFYRHVRRTQPFFHKETDS